MSQVVVVIGGGAVAPRAVAAVDEDALVIAADSGLDHAVEAGLRPTQLVGDLDSISAAGRMWAYANGTQIDEHPLDKDATDTELALALAAEQGTDVLLLAGVGDRLDHLLGTMLALGAPALACCESVRAFVGDTEIVVVHPGRLAHLSAVAGQTFSVLALHGPCRGVEVRGARWELIKADLEPTEARGVSNEAKDDVTVTVESGVLTVVLP